MTPVPDSLPVKLSRFAPAEQREAHRQSLAAAAEHRPAGKKQSRLMARAARNAVSKTGARSASGADSPIPLPVAEPVTMPASAAPRRIPRTPATAPDSAPSTTTADSSSRASSGSRIPKRSAARRATHAAHQPIAAPTPQAMLPSAESGNTRAEIANESAEPEPSAFSGTLYGNSLFGSALPEPEPSGQPQAPAGARPAKLTGPLLRSLSEWLPSGAAGAATAADQQEADLASPACQAPIEPAAATPESQVPPFALTCYPLAHCQEAAA